MRNIMIKWNVKNFLHFYFNKEVMTPTGIEKLVGIESLNQSRLQTIPTGSNTINIYSIDDIKLMVRSLSKITEFECKELLYLGWPDGKKIEKKTYIKFSDHFFENELIKKSLRYSIYKKDGSHYISGVLTFKSFTPYQIYYLLDRNFDIFDLISKGIAIEK